MKTSKNKLLITGLFSICLFILLTAVYIQISQPKRNGTLNINGLKDSVTIHFDIHGRPHIYATNINDLVFTQGYLTAQDRLFELDIARRAAKGELSEILGNKGLIRDTYVHKIGLLRHAKEELKSCNNETLNILESYSKGITAYIQEHKDTLPFEFKVLNYIPKPWQPVDSIVLIKQIAEIIDTSWQLDLIRQEVYQTIPAEKADALFEQTFPGNPTINYNAAKYLVFDEYTLQKTSLLQRWKDIKQKVALKRILAGPYFKIKRKVIEAADFLRNGPDRWEGFTWGSNCWVISSQKSKDLEPSSILANDPHMELSNPGFWYPIHLKSPEINALGLSIPGIPGILIGHNENIAWGITSLSADVQDLFIGEFKNAHSLDYNDGTQWLKAQIIKSKIKIKNKKEPYIHKSTITHCGTVLDKNHKKALILKWSTTEAKDYDSIGAIWNLTKATNWNEFRRTLKKYNGPTLSFHYADTEGNIGYQAAGVIPKRANEIGNIPISGFTCDQAWQGYIPFDELPHAYNPQVGYIVSANNKVISHDYPHSLGNNFMSPFRAIRISTLLSKEKNPNLQKNKKYQKDIYSWIANYLTVQILDAFYDSKTINQDLISSIQLLSKWDFNLDTESPQAFIFQKTYENLFRRILLGKLGKGLTNDYLKEWRASSLALINILIDEDKFWLPDGIKDYKTLYLFSLRDAVNEIKNITWSDAHNDWRWGKYHYVTFEHLFSKTLPILGPFINAGSVSVSGDKDTISAFGTNSNLKVVWGPSARVVIDLKDLNNAHIQLPLGTSSQIGSSYYKDQTEGWLKNDDEPFMYDDKLIQSNTKEKLVLNPI